MCHLESINPYTIRDRRQDFDRIKQEVSSFFLRIEYIKSLGDTDEKRNQLLDITSHPAYQYQVCQVWYLEVLRTYLDDQEI